MASFSDPDFEPMFADNITWHNDSLRQKAEAQCGNDHECLFDVASTNDLSVGLVTKDISIQLVNETNKLGKYLNLSYISCLQHKFDQKKNSVVTYSTDLNSVSKRCILRSTDFYHETKTDFQDHV